MTMTDPIADFLTRLRNANSAYHDEVTLPHSKIKANIAEILKREGFITDFRTEDARVGKSLVVQLKYGPNRERSLAGLRRVSKPGLRVYAKSTNLPRVLGGLGVAIISTSCCARVIFESVMCFTIAGAVTAARIAMIPSTARISIIVNPRGRLSLEPMDFSPLLLVHAQDIRMWLPVAAGRRHALLLRCFGICGRKLSASQARAVSRSGAGDERFSRIHDHCAHSGLRHRCGRSLYPRPILPPLEVLRAGGGASRTK